MAHLTTLRLAILLSQAVLELSEFVNSIFGLSYWLLFSLPFCCPHFAVSPFKPLFPFQVRPCGVGEGAAYHLGVKFTCQEVAVTRELKWQPCLPVVQVRLPVGGHCASEKFMEQILKFYFNSSGRNICGICRSRTRWKLALSYHPRIISLFSSVFGFCYHSLLILASWIVASAFLTLCCGIDHQCWFMINIDLSARWKI